MSSLSGRAIPRHQAREMVAGRSMREDEGSLRLEKSFFPQGAEVGLRNLERPAPLSRARGIFNVPCFSYFISGKSLSERVGAGPGLSASGV